MISEKSLSRTQQRLFGQAYGVKMWKRSHGEKGLNPKDINPKYKKEIMDLANSVSLAKLKEFAETKHKNLPEEVKEGILKDIYYKLTPDAQYDDARSGARSLANLSDYREHIKKKNKKDLDGTPKN